MVDVLLAHANFAALDPKQLDAGRPFFPLGTLYAASLLRSRGLSVGLFDATFARGPEDFLPQLEREKPRALVLYEDSFNWLSKMTLDRMRAAAFAMLGAARERGIPALAHGSDAGDQPEAYLAAGATEVALGEGEQTALEWCQRALGQHAVERETIAGLTWLERGGLSKSAPRGLRQDLDVLPWPARDLVDVERYRQAWVKRHGRFMTNLVTTRGCPYLCNWCAKPIYGNTYHSRSPADVAKEMLFLKRDLGAEALWFSDDILGLKQPWLESLAGEVERLGARLPFQCQTRADLMTREASWALARAGCTEAWLGVESGEQRVLDAMDKGITVEQVRRARAELGRVGVRVAFFVQFGYPGEDWPEIGKTRALLRELVPDDIGISVSYPQVGTRFHDAVKGRLGAKERWDTSGDLDPLFPGMFTRRFYGTLHRLVHAELKVARGRRVLRHLAREPLGFEAQMVRTVAQSARALPQLAWQRARLEVERRLERRNTPGEAPQRKLKRSAVRVRN